MRLVRQLAFVAIGFAAVCAAQQQQQRASVSGTVTSLAGEPLKNAMVRLQPQAAPAENFAVGAIVSPPEAYATTSDAQGNFRLDDVDPGKYILTAQRTGYLITTYSKADGSLERIDVSGGQSVTAIAIKMTPQAVITGKIVDEDGDPVPGARVAVARWVYLNGKKQLQNQGGGQSDFEGVYSISGLSAGSYLLTVQPQNNFPNTRQKGPIETVPPTYYPGVTDPASATAIQVTAGAVLRGTDIRLRKVQSYRIRGTVSGDPAGVSIVNLLPADAGFNTAVLGVNLSATVRQGAFEIDGVLPGVYALQATSANVRGADGKLAERNEMGRQIVSVGNQDVDDVVLQLGPGAEIRGQIAFEGNPPVQTQQQSPAATARPIIRLTGAAVFSASNGQSNPDGTFEVQHIMPGTYPVQVLGAPGTFVKSIRYGGQDVSKSVVDLTSGGGGEMQVTLSYNVADIKGSVHGSDGQPVTNATVTLWTPGAPAKDAIDFTRTVFTDSNGAFKFSDLAPGDYRVAAWEKIDQGLGTVPEFRANFEARAATVKLNENDHAQIQAPLIPASDIEPVAAKMR